MGNIIGEPIEKFVADQIDLRQKAAGAGYNSDSLARDPKILNYLNNKNAWIKLASGVELYDLEEYLLRENTAQYNKAFETNVSDFDALVALQQKNEEVEKELLKDLGDSLYNKGTQRLKDLQKFSTDGYFTENDIRGLDGINLAKKYVLFNTIQEYKNNSYINRSGVRDDNSWSSSQNKLYGGMGSNERGLQPAPGIIDIDVETINRGSIKKASVNIKAFNKFQFGIIEILYLRLGYTMMLEYGWDKQLNENKNDKSVEINNLSSNIIENEWFQGRSYSQRAMSDLIDEYQIKYSGNYNGFFGKVSNFSWKLNKDNTYDITINLISMGGVIESLQVAIPSRVTLKEQETNLDNYKIIIKDKLDVTDSAFSNVKEEPEINSKIPIAINAGTDKITNFCIDAVVNMENYLNQKKKSSDYYYVNPVYGFNVETKLKNSYFVRFGHFLNFLETEIVGNVVNEDVTSPRLEIDNNPENNYVSYLPNLFPLNPTIGLFTPINTNITIGAKDYFRPTDQQKQFTTDYLDLPEKFAFKEKGVYYGKLMNIFLNVTFIQNVLNSNKDKENNLNLYNFLEGLTSGINKLMGNTTKITPSIKNNNIIYFIDENPILGGNLIFEDTTIKTVPINLFGYNPDGTSNFVKDFGFQTKISPKTLNQISIGATAGGYKNSTNAVGYKWWNRGLLNRFEEKHELNGFNYKDTKSEADLIFDNFKRLVKIGNTGNGNRAYRRGDGFDLQYFGYRYYYKNNKKLFFGYNYSGVNADNSDEKNFKSAALKADVVKFVRDQDAKETRKKELANIDPDVIEFRKYQDILQIGNSDTINYFSNNDKFLSALSNGFRAYQVALMDNAFKKEKINSNQTGFIPVELSFTSEGISGWKIYNKLEINQRELPASYPSALKFIIRGLKDKISGNAWETSIDTISQPSTKKPMSDSKLLSEIDTIGTSNLNIPEDQKVSMVQGISLETPFTDNGLIYYPEETLKTQVVLHHTAANSSIEATINGWRGDNKGKNGKGRHISTHYIIQRDGTYDQLFPLKYWANHIGIPSGSPGAENNVALQKGSISIELESFGYVQIGRGDNKGFVFQNGKNIGKRSNLAPFSFDDSSTYLVTWRSGESTIPIRQMREDNKSSSYKGEDIFQAYTIPQINTLFEILQKIQKLYPNIPLGINSREDYLDMFPKKNTISENAINRIPGIYTHNSYRADKIDVYPAMNIVAMLGQRSNFSAYYESYKQRGAKFDVIANFIEKQNIQNYGFKNK